MLIFETHVMTHLKPQALAQQEISDLANNMVTAPKAWRETVAWSNAET
jgi:hypothetical protein